mgnify:CR=1 FL=1
MAALTNCRYSDYIPLTDKYYTKVCYFRYIARIYTFSSLKRIQLLWLCRPPARLPTSMPTRIAVLDALQPSLRRFSWSEASPLPSLTRCWRTPTVHQKLLSWIYHLSYHSTYFLICCNSLSRVRMSPLQCSLRSHRRILSWLDRGSAHQVATLSVGPSIPRFSPCKPPTFHGS